MGHLVLGGGGHAHLTALANLPELLAAGHNVTVIGPSEHHYYSGMGPGMLGGTYTPQDIRFATRHVVEKQGANFVPGKIVRVDADAKTIHMADESSLTYDVLSFNLGSYVPDNLVAENTGDIYAVKPIEKLMEARQRVLDLIKQKPAVIAVAGGGPAAVEIAGNLWHLAENAGGHAPTIHLFAGKKLMARFPEIIRKKVRHLFIQRGIQIHESGYVKTIQTGGITLKSGETISADIIFMALGVKPSPVFEASGLPTGPDGGLLVNQYLQSPAHPELFGGGDCIYFEPRPLDKVGVYAVRQNPVLYHNIKAALTDGTLQPFDPGGDYLLIFNLGGSQGVLKKNWINWSGKAAFQLKDYIDRRFMKKFQALEN
jgi:NADH dehydrogenase FAD-containing subunit